MEGQVVARFQGLSAVVTSLGANDPKVGDLCYSGNNIFRWVYNGSNSQINPGEGCIASLVSGYSVTVSSVTSQDFLIGVCRHSTIVTGSHGWVVVHGFTQVTMGANNSAAAGNCITLATDGKFAPVLVATANIGNVCGKLMSAAASGLTAPAFISCM